MSCGDLDCEIVTYLVNNHHWGSHTISMEGLVSNADCDADFDDKKEALRSVLSHAFVERALQGHVRLDPTEELLQFLARCDEVDMMDVKPRLKRKFHDNSIFEYYFD